MSIAAVASSKKTSSGSPAMAMANRTRWASPPDSVLDRRLRSGPIALRSTVTSNDAGRR